MRNGMGLAFFGTALLLASASATAADDAITVLIKGFESSATAISSRMIPFGGQLLAGLATIQIIWNSIQLLIKGEFGLETAAGTLLRPLISAAMFYGFIIVAPSWIPKIINGWLQIGSSVSHAKAINPSDIFMLGVDLAGAMTLTLKEVTGADGYLALLKTPYSSFQIGALGLILIAVFTVLSLQVALAMIKAYLWLAIAPLLLGFGGLRNTLDIALNTMKSAISIGVVVLTTYIIIGVGLELKPTWQTLIAKVNNENLNMSVWLVIGSAGLIAMAAWQVPKIANDFINGSISGGVSEAAGMAVTAAAGAVAATAGAMGTAEVAGKAAQAGTNNLAALANLANASFGDAADHGKSGMDAVTHAFGSTLASGASMLHNSMATGYDGVKDWATGGASETVPGKMAASIEASRGGSIGAGPGSSGGGAGGGSGSGSGSSSSGSSTSGGGSAPSAAMASADPRSVAAAAYSTAPGAEGADLVPSSPSDGGDAAGPLDSSSGDNQDRATSSSTPQMSDWERYMFHTPGEVNPVDMGPMPGDPGNATGATLSGTEPVANNPSWSDNLSALSSQIGSTREYLPEGDAAVTVNASLHGHNDH